MSAAGSTPQSEQLEAAAELPAFGSGIQFRPQAKRSKDALTRSETADKANKGGIVAGQLMEQEHLDEEGQVPEVIQSLLYKRKAAFCPDSGARIDFQVCILSWFDFTTLMRQAITISKSPVLTICVDLAGSNGCVYQYRGDHSCCDAPQQSKEKFPGEIGSCRTKWMNLK